MARALEENDEALARALRLLGRMEQEGTLQELADLLALVKLVKEALTDEMVISMARRLEGLAALATDPRLIELAGRLPKALQAAEQEAAQAAAGPPGLMCLVKKLRQPEVRRGLGFLLSLVKHLAPNAQPTGTIKTL